MNVIVKIQGRSHDGIEDVSELHNIGSPSLTVNYNFALLGSRLIDFFELKAGIKRLTTYI